MKIAPHNFIAANYQDVYLIFLSRYWATGDLYRALMETVEQVMQVLAQWLIVFTRLYGERA